MKYNKDLQIPNTPVMDNMQYLIAHAIQDGYIRPVMQALLLSELADTELGLDIDYVNNIADYAIERRFEAALTMAHNMTEDHLSSFTEYVHILCRMIDNTEAYLDNEYAGLYT